MLNPEIGYSKCSRAGCSAVATALVVWRNPKVHAEGREKLWSACNDHLQYLVDYVSNRGFFIEVRPLTK